MVDIFDAPLFVVVVVVIIIVYSVMIMAYTNLFTDIHIYISMCVCMYTYMWRCPRWTAARETATAAAPGGAGCEDVEARERRPLVARTGPRRT